MVKYFLYAYSVACALMVLGCLYGVVLQPGDFFWWVFGGINVFWFRQCLKFIKEERRLR